MTTKTTGERVIEGFRKGTIDPEKLVEFRENARVEVASNLNNPGLAATKARLEEIERGEGKRGIDRE